MIKIELENPSENKRNPKFNDLFKESIRNLYLLQSSNVAEYKVITITSSISSEGKSFLNSMLLRGNSTCKKVLIIDSDLRKPTM